MEGKFWDFIIDGGSEQNLVSVKMVESLGLETDRYPHLDQIKWVNNKEGVITCMGVCKIPIAIGKFYSETIFCEVVNIDVCDVVLGASWLLDVRACCRNKICEFMCKSTKVKLMSGTRPPGKSKEDISKGALHLTRNAEFQDSLVEIKHEAVNQEIEYPSQMETIAQMDTVAMVIPKRSYEDPYTMFSASHSYGLRRDMAWKCSWELIYCSGSMKRDRVSCWCVIFNRTLKHKLCFE